MNKKKLNNEIASNNILANFSYISKTLSKMDHYKLPSNPYTKENGYLRNVYFTINDFKVNLNFRFPVSAKFNNALFIDLFDVCEELFDEKSLKGTNENDYTKIVGNSIIKMFDELLQFAKVKDLRNIFDNCIYLDYRLKQISSKLRKINKYLMSSLITIYTVHFKKINSLSNLSKRDSLVKI